MILTTTCATPGRRRRPPVHAKAHITGSHPRALCSSGFHTTRSAHRSASLSSTVVREPARISTRRARGESHRCRITLELSGWAMRKSISESGTWETRACRARYDSGSVRRARGNDPHLNPPASTPASGTSRLLNGLGSIGESASTRAVVDVLRAQACTRMPSSADGTLAYPRLRVRGCSTAQGCTRTRSSRRKRKARAEGGEAKPRGECLSLRAGGRARRLRARKSFGRRRSACARDDADVEKAGPDSMRSSQGRARTHVHRVTRDTVSFSASMRWDGRRFA